MDERLIPDPILDERSRAFAALLARFPALPIDAAYLMDMESVPAAALPWLAMHFGVGPVFGLARGEGAQRALCKGALKLQRLRGTAGGLRRVARLAGGDIRRVVTPPSITFLGAWDTASRRAWLDQHPQLRVYARRLRVRATGLQLNAGYLDENTVRTDAVLRSTSRCTLWHRGTETELTAGEWRIDEREGNATLYAALGATRTGLYLGDPVAGCVASGGAAERMWTVDQRAYRYGVPILQVRSMAPGYEPLTADAEAVSERGVRLGAGCAGMHLTGLYLTDMDAETRLYRRIYLHDPAIAATSRHGPAYLGRTRLGQLPHQAEVGLQVPPQKASSALCNARGPHYLAARAPMAAISPLLDGLAWASRASDRVLIDTHQHIPVTASPVLQAGSAVAGEIVLTH